MDICRRRVMACCLLAAMAACKPKVHAGSNTALVASIARMRLTMDDHEREKFDAALIAVAFHDLKKASLLDIARHADNILPDARRAIDGKTAAEIVAEARSYARPPASKRP